MLLFVGRIQPLKAPDVVLRAAAELLAVDPELRDRLVVAVVGGPSGSGLTEPEHLAKLAGSLGIADLVRFERPAPQPMLADYYRAADVTLVPSLHRVLRAGRGRVAGLRHAGRRGSGRRPADRGERRRLRRADRRPRAGRLRHVRSGGCVRDAACRSAVAAAPSRTPAGSAGRRTVDRVLDVYSAL